jgi:hypothetical protein
MLVCTGPSVCCGRLGAPSVAHAFDRMGGLEGPPMNWAGVPGQRLLAALLADLRPDGCPALAVCWPVIRRTFGHPAAGPKPFVAHWPLPRLRGHRTDLTEKPVMVMSRHVIAAVAKLIHDFLPSRQRTSGFPGGSE